MQIDTSSTHPDHGNGLSLIQSHENTRGAEIISAPRKPIRRDDFTAILAYLDGIFNPLLDVARAKQPPAAKTKTATAVALIPGRMNEPSPEDIAARDSYLAMCNQAPTLPTIPERFTASAALRPRLPLPRRGLGAPAFGGIDAEWDRHSNGRNRLLSIQLYLIGPTGERLSKVIDVRNGAAVTLFRTVG